MLKSHAHVQRSSQDMDKTTNSDKGERQAAPYTKVEPFASRLKHSAVEHGHAGFFGMVKYGVRFFFNFYLNILAMLMPYSGPRVFLHRLRGVKIGKGVLIGFNVTIDNTRPELVTIEDGVSIAGNNIILAHSKPLESQREIIDSYIAPVTIKKNAWITVGVIVLAGVTIGEGAVVTAGSVVTKDIPSNCLAGGNPAKVIKELDTSSMKDEGRVA